MSNEQPVTVSRPDPHIAVVTIDNPPQNALNKEAREGVIRALAELSADLDIRCVVLTGAGRGFCAGADLSETRRVATGPEEARTYLQEFDELVLAIEACRVPVIAAINGPAVGGGLEVALACDIRIAASSSFFIAAGVNVGLIANFWRLTRTVGLGPAKEIVLTGDRYTPAQALQWGLVTEVHPAEDLLPAALAKAKRIASRVPLSVERVKQSLGEAQTMDLETYMTAQGEAFVALAASKDHTEALDSFLSKRPGKFTRE
ncbi:MAG: enoyl-CoA hydratase/isomerase family protein [Mycobacteriaceae bacterium]